MTQPWPARAHPGAPAETDPPAGETLVTLLARSFERHAPRTALRFMGRAIRFAEVDQLSRSLAAWLIGLGLARGERVAVMLPNLPQYPVAVAAILRAGLVVVGIDPLLGPREVEHRLRDAGARAIVVYDGVAAPLQQVLTALPAGHVLLASTGDLLGRFRGTLVNQVERHLRKSVPAFEIPGTVRFNDAVTEGRERPVELPAVGPGDIAALQYSGGATGQARAAVMLHRNLVAGVRQAEAWSRPALAGLAAGEPAGIVCALPLHLPAGFTASMLLGLHLGGCAILVPHPRDLPALLETLGDERIHGIVADPALFGALAGHPQVRDIDWRSLAFGVGAGMPVRPATAQAWLERTGCALSEGYGLSEAGLAAAGRPGVGSEPGGGIGPPLPGVELAVLDEQGRPLPAQVPGEIAIRGPQVMAGYWQRPDETARVMTADGFLRTGDIGVLDAHGTLRLLDRRQDLIRIGGTGVCPGEIEDRVTALPGVLEAAALGVPDGLGGEALLLLVVRSDPALSESAVRAHCEASLPPARQPRHIEFREALPKSSTGLVRRALLRREWRA